MTDQHHTIGDPAELAALYLAGALPDAERTAFEAHLAQGCAACDRALRELDGVFAALASSIEPVTPSAAARITALARANECLGPLNQQQLQGIKSLVAEVEKNLLEILDDAQGWKPFALDGIVFQRLSLDKNDRRLTALVHMQPGARLPAHAHSAGEQCVVLHGELSIGDRSLSAGEYRYWEPGEEQPEQIAEQACLLLVSSPLD
jgi:anti-sigma factor ChrR (cupin superfamily)